MSSDKGEGKAGSRKTASRVDSMLTGTKEEVVSQAKTIETGPV